MKKLMITVLGALLLFVGLIFLIIPGPGILFILPGLLLLSFEYPSARKWLKQAQRTARKTAVCLDNGIRKRKYAK
ncbi:MAG: PGPGW domain-containing protein [Pseudomonadota bacterium]